MIDKPNIYRIFYDLVSQIPEGRISTYGDLALQLGDIIASRAVGEMLSENEHPEVYPCYRVVMSDGSLGGFTHPDGVREKVRRLRRDGIRISNGRVENFESKRFRDFKSEFPLKKYREDIAGLEIDKEIEHSEELRALDVSYMGRVGVGVGVDFEGELSYEVYVKEAKSPYIPNYLYLREGDIYESLVRIDRVNVIDGNGVLHRDGRGVATLVGASRNVATIGLAKSLLTGTERKDGIFLGSKRVGQRVGKYFVSSGFGIDLKESVRLLTDDRHFPQTRYPDRISRRYRNEILPAQYSI